MRKELVKYDLQYQADVAALIDCRGYRSVAMAANYVGTKLGPLWGLVLDLDEDRPVVDHLKFSPTMTLLVHLFGKAVHRHGRERSKLPVMTHYRAIFDKHVDGVRFPHAIAKNDIARIIGKSRSAVDSAVSALRGKDPRFEALFEKRIAHPLYVETGIMLDVMTSVNTCFQFMFEDYEYAKRTAKDAQLKDAITNFKQHTWCSEALSNAPEPKPGAREMSPEHEAQVHHVQ